MVAQIPGAQLAVIPDAGHLLVLERPSEVAEQVWQLISRVTVPKPVNGVRRPADRQSRTVRPSVAQNRIAKPTREQGRHRP
jgi:hypothetical protein